MSSMNAIRGDEAQEADVLDECDEADEPDGARDAHEVHAEDTRTASKGRSGEAVEPKPTPKSLGTQMRSGLLTTSLAVLQTGLIAWFGFTLSGRLELAIKERKATVDGAKAMGALIVELRQDQSPEADRSLVLQLAMYGEDAIGPMVIMAMTPGPYGVDIPIFGLQRLGVTHRDATCKAIVEGQASDAWVHDAVRKNSLDTLFKEMRC